MFEFIRRLLDQVAFTSGRKLLAEGFRLADAGDFVRAERILKKASRISHRDGNIWNELAYCYGKMGDVEGALKAADRAITEEPSNPKFHNAKVGILLDECWKQTDKAGLYAQLKKIEPVLERLLKLESYPAALLSQALFAAFHDTYECSWEEILVIARLQYKTARANSSRVTSIISDRHHMCENAVELRKALQDKPGSAPSEQGA